LHPVSDHDPSEGGSVRTIREILGRFDRWTLDVFNPQYPLPTRR
jgi:hypothetical protein